MINTMYALCNRCKWFTSGTVEQYDKLFEMVRTGRKTKELALVIYICTVGWSEKDIYNELVRNGFPRN